MQWNMKEQPEQVEGIENKRNSFERQKSINIINAQKYVQHNSFSNSKELQ